MEMPPRFHPPSPERAALKSFPMPGGNRWGFKTGWVKNSYDGDTEIAGTGNLVNLTYNIGDASIVSGQTLTPWGQGNVTLGGSEKNVTVTFSNLNSNTVTGGVSLDGDITLKGTNAATALSIFNGATVNVNLNGKVSVETSGTGTAAIASGDSSAIGGILRQVLSTEEGKRVAQKINEAMK